MDQLKDILGVLKRQHFWFIVPILLVIGIFGWMTSTKKLGEEFNTNSGTVNGYVSQMKSVSGTSNHPNPQYHDGMDQLIEDRRDNIREAWEMKWERQRAELKWSDELPEDFVKLVDQMRPIETAGGDIPQGSRRAYARFVKELLPQLADQIGAIWAPVGGGRSGGRFSGATSSSDDGMGEEGTSAVVQWNPRDQGALEAKYDWGDELPSDDEVLYAQEDLWVLGTIIDIIARTNGDSITQSQAAVKAIEFIEIGAEVAPPSRVGFRVIRPQPFDTGEEGEDEEGVDEGEEQMQYGGDFTPPPPGGGMGGPPQVEAAEIVKNRYYDGNYEPIEDMQSLQQSATVAKRIPVRLRLKMDQRQINSLLVECANAPLTFEVRQLRLNPKTAGRAGGMDTGEMPAGEFASFRRARQTAKFLDDYESFDRTVELFGIIYMFNPVNDAVLGGEIPGEGDDMDDEA